MLKVQLPPLDRASTLTEILDAHAHERGASTAYVFLRDGEEEEATISFSQLRQAALGVAWALVEKPATGRLVLLAYPDGLDFIIAYLGCLFAGLEPVPVSVPRHAKGIDRFESVVARSGARMGLTDAETFERIVPRLSIASELRWIDSSSIAPCATAPVAAPTADDVALVQFTSGSTGNPRGVVVTHSQLLSNQRAIREAFGHGPQAVVAGWLPLFHDMGLIGNVLQPLCLGIPSVLMPPAAFIQRPIRWLSAISRYRATTSGAPNFAYDLCARRVTREQKRDLDLSSWDLAYNGAEPVRADSLERFVKAFQDVGFRREALFPCYGMAEATLFASGGPKGRARVLSVCGRSLDAHELRLHDGNSETDVRQVVSCGKPARGLRVAIVGPYDLRPCAESAVGEIWLSGSSVANGYANDPEATSNAFRARLESDPSNYLRTGDLGFMHEGELFVTGRLKDLIIIRGRNHYPQDIELTVERAHPHLEAGGVAAFAVEGTDSERLVVVAEVALEARHAIDRGAVFAAVRSAVASSHELTVADLRLIKPRSLPKTSSGKVQRALTRNMYLAGLLEEARESGSSVSGQMV